MFLEMVANLGTYLMIHETVTGLMVVVLNGDFPYSQILKVISHCESVKAIFRG